MLLNQALSLGHLLRLEAEVRGELNVRINPEFRFPIRVLHVDVSAPLLARKELEPVALGPENGRTHRTSLA